jgi:hypothetical protein
MPMVYTQKSIDVSELQGVRGTHDPATFWRVCMYQRVGVLQVVSHTFWYGSRILWSLILFGISNLTSHSNKIRLFILSSVCCVCVIVFIILVWVSGFYFFHLIMILMSQKRGGKKGKKTVKNQL